MDVSGQPQWFGLKFAVYCWKYVTVTGMALALKYCERRHVRGEGERAPHFVGRFPGFFEIVRLIWIHELHYILLSVPRSKHYLGYKNQSVLYREIISVVRSTQNTQRHCVGRTFSFWVLNMVVHIVISGLWRVSTHYT